MRGTQRLSRVGTAILNSLCLLLLGPSRAQAQCDWYQKIDYFFASTSAAVVTFCRRLFGLLSTVCPCFAYRISYQDFWLTSHYAAWYAQGTILALVVLVGLATYALRTSFGKQPIAHGSLVRDGYTEPFGNNGENF